ncbi:interferon gamma 1 isoform X2 [Misgurnus anguillicaudatus]|uniref:interferon gamma 1 isoform X2 n=1 Tax=Misgurnus anguillicaudatus TaxID=75329 RepID=UPI00243495FF|nr:interferon gamma 1 isoform X2 [Misgurnus anguillicaudatus]
MEYRVTMLFLGMCLLASQWMTCESRNSVPENLDQSISELNKFYGEKAGELHNGQPVFLLVLKDLKETEQKLLMSIIIETYSRIFTRMHNESKDEDVRERLDHVLDHLNKIQENYFPGKSAELKTYAEVLWAIKENDPMVQRKALYELKKVYREATQLRHGNNKDRRRRQTKNLKRQKSDRS